MLLWNTLVVFQCNNKMGRLPLKIRQNKAPLGHMAVTLGIRVGKLFVAFKYKN